MSEREYLMERVSKIVIRTPTRLVRRWSDKIPRPMDDVGRISRQMHSPKGYEEPVLVLPRRSFQMTDQGKEKARRLGLKSRTLLPTPKLMDGHHRLKAAELDGRKSMLVDYRLRDKPWDASRDAWQVKGEGNFVPPNDLPKRARGPVS